MSTYGAIRTTLPSRTVNTRHSGSRTARPDGGTGVPSGRAVAPVCVPSRTTSAAASGPLRERGGDGHPQVGDGLDRSRHGGHDRVRAGDRGRPAADLQDDVRVQQAPKGVEVVRRERGEHLADHGQRLLGFVHGTSHIATAETTGRTGD